MDTIVLLATIIMFAVLIFSGTTLNLSHKIQTSLISDGTTSDKVFTDSVIMVYKVIAWIGFILYLTMITLYEHQVNFGMATLILVGCLMKYFYVIFDDSDAYQMRDEFIEHPLSVTFDVITNLSIVIQSIMIIIQL